MSMANLHRHRPLLGGSNHRYFIKTFKATITDYMIIPCEFAKDHCKDMPETITLSTADQVPWPVNVASRGGIVYLGRGWPEFAEAHDITQHSIALFGYDQDKQMLVTIFEYPGTVRSTFPPTARRMPRLLHDAHGVKNSYSTPVVKSNGLSDQLDNKWLHTLEQTAKSAKVLGSSRILGMNVTPRVTTTQQTGLDQETTRKKPLKRKYHNASSIHTGTPNKTPGVKETRLDESIFTGDTSVFPSIQAQQKKFPTYNMSILSAHSRIGHCYILLMKTSITQPYLMELPLEYVGCLITYGQTDVSLVVFKDAKVSVFTVTCYRSTASACLTLGWKEFVAANQLKAKDCCRFHYQKAPTATWYVEIIRGFDDYISASSDDED